MKSEEHRYLEGRLITIDGDLNLNNDKFPTDVVWVGLGQYATNYLVPILFGAPDHFESWRQIMNEAQEFLNDLDHDRAAPRTPVIANSSDPEYFDLTPKYSVRRVKPDSIDRIQGTSISETHAFARQIKDQYEAGEQIVCDVDQNNPEYVSVYFNLYFGSHCINTEIPIYIHMPEEEDLNRRYRSAIIPIAILSDDSSMDRNKNRPRETTCSIYPFQIS